jgi:hypothetical protein
MPSIPPEAERGGARNDAREATVRTKLTAAILYLDLALEAVSGEPVRTPIQAASRAAWRDPNGTGRTADLPHDHANRRSGRTTRGAPSSTRPLVATVATSAA